MPNDTNVQVESENEEDLSSGPSNSTSASSESLGLLPVTLRQVSEATQPYSGKDAPWYIAGRQGKKLEVLIVASVLEENLGSKPGSRTVWYKLVDGTNRRPVTALRSFDDIKTLEKVVPETEGTVAKQRYVRIKGHLVAGSMGGQPAISCHTFQVVKDPHEPYAHVLSVMYTALCIQKGPPPERVLQGLSDTAKYPSGHPPALFEDANEPLPKWGPVPEHSAPSANPPVSDGAPRAAQQMPPAEPAPHFQTPPSSPRKGAPTTPHAPATEPPPTPSSSRRSANMKKQDKHSAQDIPSKTGPESTGTAASPGSSPSESASGTRPPPEKAKQSRRLSTHDPLSHLPPFQRKVLLKIIEATTVNPEGGIGVHNLVTDLQTEGETVDAIELDSTLDALEEMGHIVNLEKGLAYKAVEQKGKRPSYGNLHYG